MKRLFLGFLILFAGCASGGADPRRHPWFAVPPVDKHEDLSGGNFDVAGVWEVSASGLAEALSHLRNQAAVPVSQLSVGDEVFGVSADLLPSLEQLYLVRALYLYSATGGFTVSYCRGSLSVWHYCLGDALPPIQETALLVALPDPPAAVYVGCSMK